MNERDIENVTGSAQFADRLTGVLNDGALSLMPSIGHRTGLFDAMASLPASTSAQIAQTAGLDERYVREWLGAMTTGGIVDHDADQLTFVLPRERAAWLTTAAGPANMALQAQRRGARCGPGRPDPPQWYPAWWTGFGRGSTWPTLAAVRAMR